MSKVHSAEMKTLDLSMRSNTCARWENENPNVVKDRSSMESKDFVDEDWGAIMARDIVTRGCWLKFR